MISYVPLRKLISKRNISMSRLAKEVGLSESLVFKLMHDKGNIFLSSIDKICKYFNCQPSDIMEVVPD